MLFKIKKSYIQIVAREKCIFIYWHLTSKWLPINSVQLYEYYY